MAARRTGPTRELKVGDRVRFNLGGHRVIGVIVEDRGRIGAGGRRLYAVRAQLEAVGESTFELPSDELQAA